MDLICIREKQRKGRDRHRPARPRGLHHGPLRLQAFYGLPLRQGVSSGQHSGEHGVRPGERTIDTDPQTRDAKGAQIRVRVAGQVSGTLFYIAGQPHDPHAPSDPNRRRQRSQVRTREPLYYSLRPATNRQQPEHERVTERSKHRSQTGEHADREYASSG